MHGETVKLKKRT